MGMWFGIARKVFPYYQIKSGNNREKSEIESFRTIEIILETYRFLIQESERTPNLRISRKRLSTKSDLNP
jgi:ribosomal protein L28